MIKMNKKGQHWVLNLTEILPLVVVLVISIITIVLLVGSSVHFITDSFDAEAIEFATELLYTKGGFSYYDRDLDRVYPGLIDMERVQSEEFPKELDRLFNTTGKNKVLGAKISLYDCSEKHTEAIEIIYNEEYYKKWHVLANLGYNGPGGARKRNIDFKVNTLYPNGERYCGTMVVEVVKSNS